MNENHEFQSQDVLPQAVLQRLWNELPGFGMVHLLHTRLSDGVYLPSDMRRPTWKHVFGPFCPDCRRRLAPLNATM